MTTGQQLCLGEILGELVASLPLLHAMGTPTEAEIGIAGAANRCAFTRSVLKGLTFHGTVIRGGALGLGASEITHPGACYDRAELITKRCAVQNIINYSFDELRDGILHRGTSELIFSQSAFVASAFRSLIGTKC